MTIRQRRRAKILGKNRTVEAELLEAGYAPSTARKQPPTVTKAKGWQKLLEQRLPDDDLLTATREALQANRKRAEITDRDDKGRPIYEYYDEEDHPTRLKAAEQGYKLKGKFTDGTTINQQINNYAEVTEEKRNKYGI